ncbi:MAG: PilN domain-containing protein [Tahibacter sp.]
MAITDALEPQLVRLRARYAKTPLPRFFAWWGGELVACLPQRWRAALAEATESLLLSRQEQDLLVGREGAGGAIELGRIDLQRSADEQRLDFERLRGAIDEPQLRQFYCVPIARTLRRTLSLPVAAEENLRQVLSFEMDRQTPFKADQVYFDYRVLGRDAAGRSLHVDLVVLPRQQLDAELVPIAALGIELDGVDCWQDVGASRRMGINLLPVERRARRRNLRLRLNLALIAVAVVLALGVMSRTVTNREQALESMTAEVEKAQNEAKQVTALRHTLEETIESANFLAQKKRGSIAMVQLLKDLTARLPDNTYLERLNVTEDGRVELQGLSDQAPNLIEQLQKSDVISDPAFQGVIQDDPRVKKARFNLVAQLKTKAPDKASTGGDAGKSAHPPKEEGGGHASVTGGK